MYKYLLVVMSCSLGLWSMATANRLAAQADLPTSTDGFINTGNIDLLVNHLPSAGDAAQQFFERSLITPINRSDEYFSDKIFRKAPLKIDPTVEVEKMDKLKVDRFIESLSDREFDYMS